eukprot:TRINITY_DN1645_c0_g2_i1.p2 TRINITY_DN1645_c0_g2~~TRINITY_DN1645_c0_g2_i1.p2  ORF type:complete len:193 (-),score=46.69 TRINITY_DN1645_c0_g2_i1:32-610(-)
MDSEQHTETPLDNQTNENTTETTSQQTTTIQTNENTPDTISQETTPQTESPVVTLLDQLREDQTLAQNILANFAGIAEENKLVLIVRTDLGMKRGKVAAQCSHATLGAYLNTEGSENTQRWLRRGSAKVVLKVGSEEEMDMIRFTAKELGVPTHVVTDAGRTQIASGSRTVLALGPAPKSLIDVVSGHLKLY